MSYMYFVIPIHVCYNERVWGEMTNDKKKNIIYDPR